ncbi:MAG: NADPH:quinone reductase [Verrucomicrobiales bacterium]|nr:NADPH:quinone reductase [Verrucomicrobiales bacterium]
MKAAYVEQPGPPENLIYGDRPMPEPGEGEVLVKTGALAVNPVDTYARSGVMPFEVPLPYVVGCDLAGTVEAVGVGVERFSVGDRVYGSNQGLLGRQGSFAEYVAVDEGWLYPTPDGVSDEEAAALVLVGITAHLGLVGRAHVMAGESVFVVGGTGGVGSTVVQMAKALGARVGTCCGSGAKCEEAKVLGADYAFNYKEVGMAEGIAGFAKGGVDVFWETQRSPDFDVAVGALAPRGRMVLMAGRDARPEFPVGPFYFKQCRLEGFVMFNCTPDEQRECSVDLNRWMAEGAVKAKVGARFSLADTGAAHRLQEENTIGGAGTLMGKIVVTP